MENQRLIPVRQKRKSFDSTSSKLLMFVILWSIRTYGFMFRLSINALFNQRPNQNIVWELLTYENIIYSNSKPAIVSENYLWVVKCIFLRGVLCQNTYDVYKLFKLFSTRLSFCIGKLKNALLPDKQIESFAFRKSVVGKLNEWHESFGQTWMFWIDILNRMDVLSFEPQSPWNIRLIWCLEFRFGICFDSTNDLVSACKHVAPDIMWVMPHIQIYAYN